MRVVIDTNVLISALIRRQGVTGQVLRFLRNGRFTMIYSTPLIVELVEVLSRPRIKDKYHIQSDDIMALVNLIRLRGQLVTPTQKIHVCPDPADNRFLEAAVEGDADAIVSGDSDLLEMNEFEKVPILSVGEFLARF